VGLCGCNDRDGDSECGGNLSGIICNGPVGICVPGCSGAPMRNGCPPPQTCIPPNGPVGVCAVPTCTSDLNCSVPRRKCDLNAVPATCVGCLMDTDCSGGFVCDSGASKSCVECTATKTQNCTAANAGTRCLVNLTCGCQADMECGTNISGRVCNTDVSKCTYGCRGTGGNGCPPGFVCSSTDNSIGQCLTPGAADAGVTPDAAPDATPDLAADVPADMAVAMDAAADAGVDAAADAPADTLATFDLPLFPDFPPVVLPDTGVPPSTDDAGTGGNVPRGTYVAGGGCKCDTGRGQGGTGLWFALAVPVALLIRRRRK
jgi:MYXO-CTERM domain-containing protein